MFLFIRIKAHIIQVQFFKSYLRKKKLDNLCLDEVTVGTTAHRIVFWHLKDEANIKQCITFEELVKEIDDYIKYYNNYRAQWALKR